MKISGHLRDGKEFRFMKKAKHAAPSTFTAVTDGEVIVSRTFADLFNLPGQTPVIAHWHGQYRTDAFLSTLDELKAMAKEQGML